MEYTVEEIMTGKANIETVLQQNKDKIQSITNELEDIVRKGYFDILNNTENIIQFSKTDSQWPRLFLPNEIEIPEQQKVIIESPVIIFLHLFNTITFALKILS